MSDTVTNVLAERGARYGSFKNQAFISQILKSAILGGFDRKTAAAKFYPDQIEAIEMICHKLSRIANGDPDYADSWVDIAGYATLVADRLTEEQNAAKATNEAASFEPSDGYKISGLNDKASLQNLESAASRGNKRNTKRRD